ncbi:MAG: ankyrin repeat domain-containing protein [Vicinamibacterales bacterium]
MADHVSGTAQPGETPGTPGARTAAEDIGRRGGCLIPLALAAGGFVLLRDFVATPVAAVLAPVGAGFTQAGLYLTLGGLRYAIEGIWYAALVPIGILLLAGAAATVSPAGPGELLAQSAAGRALLEHRMVRLEAAIGAGDTRVARKLAGRGLGDPAAADDQGTPLLHLATSREMAAALLDAGLDPDAAGAGGQTLLMRTDDPELARLLLAAGANPDVRSDNGFTALMLQGDRPDVARLILEAGADVHAVADSGRTVADLVSGPVRALLADYAGGRPLQETGGVTPRGRDDWLVADPGAADRADGSGVVGPPAPLRPGDTGALEIVIDNPSPSGRVVEVHATLQSGLLLLEASHDGAVETRGRPGVSSTVRWPWLSLPAGGRGRLQLQVIAQPDDVVSEIVAGDLAVDVRVVDLPARAEQALQFSQPRAGPAARVQSGEAAFYGPVAIAVAVVAAFWLIVGRRRQGERDASQQVRIARVVLLGGAALCAGLGGQILWSLVEPRAQFEAASCEILDQRVVVAEVTSNTAPARRNTTSGRTTTRQGYPIAAVAIATGAERRFAVGPSVEDRRFAIGRTVPCRVDPDRPDRFTIVGGTSLAGGLLLAMVLGVAVVLFLLASRVGRLVDPRGA